MAVKKLVAAALTLAVATPSLAFDVRETGTTTMFYISIPLDGPLKQWGAGLQLQGGRDYPAINIDSRMLRFTDDGDFDAKWIIAGLVAAGAAFAIGSKDKGSTSSLQEQQTQHQLSQGGTGSGGGGSGGSGGSGAQCPAPVVDPCAK